MTEQFVVSRAPLIANYAALLVAFVFFVWVQIRPAFGSVKARFLAGYGLYYGVYVAIGQAIDRYITYRVYTFDHDGDQVFQSDELVGELGFFWQAMIQDTGRTFAPVTGLFTCAVGAIIAYGLAYVCARLVGLYRT